MQTSALDTCLSFRGYNVSKKDLREDEVSQIKKDLSVSPYIPEDFVNERPKPFKLYQESESKLYLPKCYGLQKFGAPKSIKLHEGEDINISFQGSLRPEQEEPVAKYLDAAKDPARMGGILNVFCGGGKCLGRDTPVLMFDGKTKLVQDIVVGDMLMGDDSKPRLVLSTCHGYDKLYRVLQEKANSYVVNSAHILTVKCVRTFMDFLEGEIYDIAIEEYIKVPKDTFVGYSTGVDFQYQTTTYDPLVYGLRTRLGDKHDIPDYFKYNSRYVRCNFLRGVFYDCVFKNITTFESHYSELIDDIVFICRSVGLYAYKIQKQVDSHTIVYYAHIFGVSSLFAWNMKESCKSVRSAIEVQKAGEGEYYGFEITGNGRFLLEDFTVTHNTTMAIYIMCQLQKKAMVVCHKDFLLQQWKERINQFAPNARIGLIKAKVVDTDDKDIVLASLQSLAMKDYPEELWKQFGMVVIDECHHTSAEVFSKALRKVNFKYSLGLSATIKRKDGLTKVFLWHLGGVVHKATKRQDTLRVELCDYYDPNPKYSMELKGYGNKLNVAGMINNICGYQPRTQYIVNKLKEVLSSEPHRKTFILSDRRQHLIDLHNAFKAAGLSSAFYVGGMKQDDLKKSEEEQIILATYHIASEGFDCPGLDTLILASPKSDVIQCVGRILRTPEKLRKHVPLVIDLVDNFSLFSKQGKKRYTYYKSCNYKITGKEMFETSASQKVVLSGPCFLDDVDPDAKE